MQINRLYRLARLSFWLSLAMVLASTSRAEVTSGVSGFMTLTIKGHGGHAASALSFIGLGMTRPVVYQGNLESVGINTITDQQAGWTDGQFNGVNGAHYIEIASGPGAGLMTDIVGTIAGAKNLTLADD